MDVVEVRWSISLDLIGLRTDISFDPSSSGSILLQPKTSVSQQFLKLKVTTGGASPPPISFGFSIGDSSATHNLQHLYSLPLRGDPRVVQGFNGAATHTDALNRFAVDFEAAVGTTVLAARDGLVVATDGRNADYPSGRTIDVKALTEDQRDKLPGNYVLIRHPDFTYAIYQHLTVNGAKAKLGDEIKEGDLVGLSGNSGISSGPHLHFAVLIPTGRGGFESVEFNFKDKLGQAVRPQEGKRPSEWVVDKPIPIPVGPLIQDDL